MSSLVFKNAKIFLGGYDLSGDFNRIELSYEAESLDATVFGNDSRVRRGGLKTSRAAGSGLWQAGANLVDRVLFDSVGFEDAVLMLFPDGVTEGSTSTGSGYMEKTLVARYGVGGAGGDLLPVTLEAETRGAGT